MNADGRATAGLDTAERALARLVGLAESYDSFTGERIETSAQAIRMTLEAMGLATGAGAPRSYRRLAAVRRRIAPALICAQAGEETPIPLRGAKDERIDWRLTRENGETADGRSPALRDARGRASFTLPAQPMGYHRLEIGGACATIVSAPARCWRPAELARERAWGVAAQVYALHDYATLTIGGYREIGALAAAAGACGASFLGLSPLHALFAADRSRNSPYSPSNRMMLETLFIDPRGAPGLDPTLLAQAAQTAQSLRAGPLIDHEAAWRLVRPLLHQAWRGFSAQEERGAFEAFRARGGRALADHALFEALSEAMCAQGRMWWGEWPADLQDPGSPACEQARADLAQDIGFHAFLQWLADSQLEQAARAARESGMEIGLYRDLAVGADRAGSEIWRKPDDYLLNASIGAPPDLLGPAGQNWGLPPFDPLRLEDSGLRPFRRLLAANMRCAGAIRIDHAFQLERLYLVPEGASARDGAYIANPFAALLACLRIESVRARCMVIAEDLGTAPKGFSETIMRSGLLSYRLLLFERDAEGGFTPPHRWPRDALAAVSTHDLPTLAGWRRGLDVALRNCFAGAPVGGDAREREAAALENALAREGLTPARRDDEGFRHAVLRFLARTPALLCAAQADDLAGEWSQPNLPGPETGHPNWRRRLGLSIDAMAREDGPLARAAACMTQEGRGLRKAAGALACAPPRATYRLQLRPEFAFHDVARLAPYLERLGVSHVYLSPIMAAGRGSAHGYDATDPARISPALGGEAGFAAMSDALQAHGLKILLDIAPNHVSASLETDEGRSWWRSLLEWGRASPLADAFDVDWERPGAQGKLLAATLDVPLAQALRENDFTLVFDRACGGFGARRARVVYPLNPLDCAFLVERAIGAAAAQRTHAGEPRAALRAALLLLRDAARARGHERHGLGEAAKAHLADAARAEACARAIDVALADFNADGRRPQEMARLLGRQAYRLAHWRLADSQLNHRRFFDVNALAGLRVERPKVFARVHEKPLALAREGRIAGFRIDHIDGLADPAGYLDRLQAHAGPGFYVVVEKILARDEPLPPWPVAGTTGYETLTRLDALFVAQENEAAFDDVRAATAADERPFAQRLRATKGETLDAIFQPELQALAAAAQTAAGAQDLDLREAMRGWRDLIAALPVYRTYLGSGAPGARDAGLLRAALAQARETGASDALAFIEATLFDPAPDEASCALRRRFEQLSGPTMAKSLEDTLFYRDARFVALNEVGGAPDAFGLSVDEFHAHAELRARTQPHGLHATQTHDAKRGEDVRARLAALSHDPQTWRALFAAAPAPERPDANDRSLLLQTFIGAWPAHGASGAPPAPDAATRARFQAYATKALRESKRRTSWRAPNAAYEDAARRWIEQLCAHDGFLEELALRLPALARAGDRVSLARTALKLVIPGVPDIYQGCEGADFSLVDPDNRRPVDYARRMRLMETGGRGFEACKFALVRTLLADRKQSPDLYAFGDYEPLAAPKGWIGFRRSHGAEALLAAIRLAPFAHTPPPGWAMADAQWRNLLREVAFPHANGEATSPPAIVLKAAQR